MRMVLLTHEWSVGTRTTVRTQTTVEIENCNWNTEKL